MQLIKIYLEVILCAPYLSPLRLAGFRPRHAGNGPAAGQDGGKRNLPILGIE